MDLFVFTGVNELFIIRSERTVVFVVFMDCMVYDYMYN